MNKYEYFTRSMKDKAHYSRNWMLRVLSVVLDDVSNGDVKWALRHTETAVEVCAPQGHGHWDWEVLEDAKPYEIPFIYHDFVGVTMQPGDVENLFTEMENATWGDLIFNSRVLVYAAGSRIGWREGPIDLKEIENIFMLKMKSDVPEDQEEPEQLYVKHYKRFGKAIGDLAGYELLIPSVTERALQAPANNIELRNKLYAENKDELDNPVVQVKIQNELVKNYIDNNLKGDPSEGFLYKTKSLHTALKRMFLIHGPESGFEEGGRATLVPNSLEEGIDINYYPEMVNSLRAGSYYRGALTALAGEDVDLMSRIFQNAKIVPGFCGTPDTMEFKVDKRRLGRTFIIDGKGVMITEENLGEYEGKIYGMFSPMYCKTPHGDVCTVCMGKKLEPYADALGSMVQELPSTMMAVMMGSAHAKQLKTITLDVENFLR